MNEQGLDVVALTLRAWLQNFEEPSSTPTAENSRLVLRTTEDIVTELADMVEAAPETIAQMMAQAGHTILFREDGRHGWALIPKRGKS